MQGTQEVGSVYLLTGRPPVTSLVVWVYAEAALIGFLAFAISKRSRTAVNQGAGWAVVVAIVDAAEQVALVDALFDQLGLLVGHYRLVGCLKYLS
jgi:hypothetical protein